MKKFIITPAIALAAPRFGLGTANAGTDSYLAHLREDIPYVVQQYGPQALISEGYKVCRHWGGADFRTQKFRQTWPSAP